MLVFSGFSVFFSAAQSKGNFNWQKKKQHSEFVRVKWYTFKTRKSISLLSPFSVEMKSEKREFVSVEENSSL